jgi:hypothetical protein
MFVAFVLCTAWVIGTFSAQSIYPVVHVWTAIIVAGSLALVLTEFMNFPDPFDKKLLKDKQEGSMVSPRDTRAVSPPLPEARPESV